MVQGIDAHPVAGGSGELDDTRTGVTASERGFQVESILLGLESACLDAPLTVDAGGGIGEGFDAYLRDAHTIEIDFLGGALGEIENAAVGEGTAVGDADQDGFAIGEIGDAGNGSER